MGPKNELGLAVRQPQAGGGLVAPEQLVTEPVPVEGEALVQVGDRELDAVDLAEQAAGGSRPGQAIPPLAREMTRRWISEVPSKRV